MIMNGPSETATLPPTPQSNGVLFSPYNSYNHHFSSNGHFHFYTNNNVSYAGEPLIPTNNNHNNKDDIHVTILQIDQSNQSTSQQPQYPNSYCHNRQVGGEVMNSHHHNIQSHHQHNHNQHDLNNDFVTVLKIVSTGATILTTSTMTTTSHSTMNGSYNQRVFVDNKRGEIEEEVTIYRLPGERLGMALRFDGGQSATETIRHVFVQSITLNSPSSKAIGLMLGMLREGDEILQIDGRASSSLTRLECITLLRDAPVCIRLFVRRSLTLSGSNQIQMDQNCQLNQTHQPIVPKVSNCCQMLPIHLPNSHMNNNDHNNHTEVQNHCFPPSSLSSSLSATTNLLTSTDNSNSCPETIVSIPKKVPPPVPPRMATTTLSSKRKPRPMPIPPDTIIEQQQQQQQQTNNVESLIMVNNQSSEPTIIPQDDIEQSAPPPIIQAEKPPRRKNLHNNNNNNSNNNGNNNNSGNPPPLPPRRPKGPPPKPPTDRIISQAQTTSVVNVVNNNNHNNNHNPTTNTIITKSLPSISLMTVTCSKASTDVIDSIINVNNIGSHSGKIESICSTTSSSTTTTKTTTTLSSTSHPSKTTKVTFNISNSKVSSFIRQTAEKLHRRLSGKTTSNESDEENTNNNSSKGTVVVGSTKNDKESQSGKSNINNVIILNKSDEKSLTTSTNISQQSPPSIHLTPPIAASYVDFSQDIEESFESDTDDTSSSVSTIIERGSFSNSLVSQMEQNLNQSIFTEKTSDIDDMSIVDRVLSPFEKLENELNNETPSLCLSPSSLLTPPVTSSITADSLETDLSLPSLTSTDRSNNECRQLSSDKILKLIDDDEQLNVPIINERSLSVESPNSINNNTEFRRDQSAIEPDPTGNDDTSEPISNHVNNYDDDDEDLDAIKNDIFSRLEDDKDDFMIDTDYLNESSSRFMFHHNSSELILNSYSELSSITEEDEEEDVPEIKFLDSKQVESQTKMIEKTTNNVERPMCNESKDYETITSDSQTSKVSLDNVFEFLNKATDDFEFVERMLELTNDKIDSIDDIMRIRESLRGLQESEQRQNLQRFLDGKDVFEELIALSSPSSSSSSSSSMFSSASSPDNEFPVNIVKTNDTNEKQSKMFEANSTEEFTSLPVCLSEKSSMIKSKSIQQANNKSIKLEPNESKIPTLLPKSLVATALNKRSQSISNIFTRSNGFNSLIETKPSLIPRPISNFNLSLPSNNVKQTIISQQQQKSSYRISHNCLNRSTSMQSIFTNNSLPRSQINKTNKVLTRRQTSNVTSSSLTNSFSNYHHNCLKNQSDSSSLYYGSLSRSASKSSNNVYNTGSLPRPSKPININGKNLIPTTLQYESSNHNGSNQDFRTTSLTDLTYESKNNLPRRNVIRNTMATMGSSGLCKAAESATTKATTTTTTISASINGDGYNSHMRTRNIHIQNHNSHNNNNNNNNLSCHRKTPAPYWGRRNLKIFSRDF